MGQYEPFTPPFELDFIASTARQAQRYFEYYVSQIPHRVEMLQDDARRTPGFEQWSPYLSDLSIVGLALWLKERGRGREVTDEEPARVRVSIQGPLRDVLPESRITMTPTTWSYCVEAAMYIGGALRSRSPEVSWRIGPSSNAALTTTGPSWRPRTTGSSGTWSGASWPECRSTSKDGLRLTCRSWSAILSIVCASGSNRRCDLPPGRRHDAGARWAGLSSVTGRAAVLPARVRPGRHRPNLVESAGT